MQTVGLAMIVRNEEGMVDKCLDAARPLIDHWTIVDTGSTDRTREIVQEKLAGIPGTLHCRKWRSYEHNRTDLLGLAQGTADYLLTIDADMTVTHDGPLPDLTADLYYGRLHHGILDYAWPALIRAGKPWRYRGVAHAYLDCDEPHSQATLDGLTIAHLGPSGSAEKLARDLDLLSAEHARNPGDARTVFYLAQTYKDLGMVDEAIHHYRVRAGLNGSAEERFYARYELGVLLCEHKSFLEGSRELLAAWEMRPTRVEPLRALANVATHVADKYPYPDDLLFVHRNAYTDRGPA